MSYPRRSLCGTHTLTDNYRVAALLLEIMNTERERESEGGGRERERKRMRRAQEMLINTDFNKKIKKTFIVLFFLLFPPPPLSTIPLSFLLFFSLLWTFIGNLTQ